MTEVTNALSETLKAWIIKNEAQYYKNISVAITPVKVETKDSKVEGTFNVRVSEMLKVTTPKELPAIRGMERFKDLKSKGLLPNQIHAVDKEIDNWIKETNGYIGKTETLNMDFKVVVDVSKEGNILPETAIFFLSTAQGNFYQIESLIPPESEMEREGFNHAKEIADKAKNATVNNFVVDTYQRLIARDYANSWTSNPPDGEGNDQYEYLGDGFYSWWDTTHWKVGWPTNPNDPDNPGEFIFSLNSSFYDNDCADYVSQALYKGGVPMDNIWYCTRYSTSLPSYTWRYVPALKNYMISKGYWEPSSYEWANAGSVIVHPNDHVMMVVKNDTIHHALSAHTRDRQEYAYTYSGYYSQCEYYTVHVWVGTNNY